MPTFTVHQAKTNLSKLIAQAEAGEEVTISRGDKPAVRLVVVAAEPDPKPRVPGLWKGRIGFDESFFDPLPDEELALWNGEGD